MATNYTVNSHDADYCFIEDLEIGDMFFHLEIPYIYVGDYDVDNYPMEFNAINLAAKCPCTIKEGDILYPVQKVVITKPY